MRVVAGVAALSLVAALSACAATTYDTSVSTTIAGQPVVVTTTTLPSGTAAELLPQLLAEAASLSNLIVTKGDDIATADRIIDLWGAVQQEIATTRPELLGDFDANVRRCLTAAQRHRPADADKAYVNLQALVASFLAP